MVSRAATARSSTLRWEKGSWRGAVSLIVHCHPLPCAFTTLVESASCIVNSIYIAPCPPYYRCALHCSPPCALPHLCIALCIVHCIALPTLSPLCITYYHLHSGQCRVVGGRAGTGVSCYLLRFHCSGQQFNNPINMKNPAKECFFVP